MASREIVATISSPVHPDWRFDIYEGSRGALSGRWNDENGDALGERFGPVYGGVELGLGGLYRPKKWVVDSAWNLAMLRKNARSSKQNALVEEAERLWMRAAHPFIYDYETDTGRDPDDYFKKVVAPAVHRASIAQNPGGSLIADRMPPDLIGGGQSRDRLLQPGVPAVPGGVGSIGSPAYPNWKFALIKKEKNGRIRELGQWLDREGNPLPGIGKVDGFPRRPDNRYVKTAWDLLRLREVADDDYDWRWINRANEVFAAAPTKEKPGEYIEEYAEPLFLEAKRAMNMKESERPPAPEAVVAVALRDAPKQFKQERSSTAPPARERRQRDSNWRANPPSDKQRNYADDLALQAGYLGGALAWEGLGYDGDYGEISGSDISSLINALKNAAKTDINYRGWKVVPEPTSATSFTGRGRRGRKTRAHAMRYRILPMDADAQTAAGPDGQIGEFTFQGARERIDNLMASQEQAKAKAAKILEELDKPPAPVVPTPKPAPAPKRMMAIPKPRRRLMAIPKPRRKLELVKSAAPRSRARAVVR